MAWSILILALLIFAVRGYFLALPGVAARVTGIVAGYLTAFHYRGQLGQWLGSELGGQYHPLALEAIAGVGLFFGTLLACSLVIQLGCRLLATLIPPLNPLLNRQRLPSRLAGALANGGVAVALVLIGLWGYGLVALPPPSPLQQSADRFGQLLFDGALQQYQHIRYRQTTTVSKQRVASPPPQAGSKGTAIISSASKTLRIEVDHHDHSEPALTPPAAETTEPFALALPTSTLQQQMPALLADKELRSIAESFVKENPEAVQNALNNPQVRQLLKQLQPTQATQ